MLLIKIESMPTNRQFEEIELVRRYIRKHSDEQLDRAKLANMIGYSEIHFHRLFTAFVGETLTTHIRRIRMEQAGRRLLQTQEDVTTIALDSGYQTHAAFCKVFKRYFSVSPSAFRKMNTLAAAHLITRRIPLSQVSLIMKPTEIVSLPDQKVLYARATEKMTGPAFQHANIEAYNKLVGFMEKENLFPHIRSMIAIYPDPVEVGQTVRFDFGTILAAGVEPVATAEVAYQTLPAGRWAKFEHVGPYDTLWATWGAIYRDWLPASGESLRNEALCFEDYVDNPNEVEPEKLRTEIYIPLK